eukprot:maker-scaffold_8-snap-gene-12.51-mRNA-1 protein AED:0.00 eAED:0.00 QI:371/1/1/1/1/1/2/796/315
MQRETRKTAGKRVTELDENGEEFYKNDTWKDFSDDDDIATDEFDSSEMEDIEDSDIDAVDEELEAKVHEKEAEQEEKELNKRSRRSTRSTAYKAPKPKPATKKKTTAKTIKKPTEKTKKRTTRSSTKKKAIKKYIRAIKQIDFLGEAALTEEENKRQLVGLMMLQEKEEDQIKKKWDRSKADRFKDSKKEDLVEIRSNKLGTLYFFGSEEKMREGINFDRFVTEKEFRAFEEAEREEIELKSSVKKKRKRKYQKVQKRKEEEEEKKILQIKAERKPKCAITGEPAKYRDPLTQKYYSTIDAFKQIREQYAKETKN